MATRKPKQTPENELISFVKDQEFLENFLVWHIDRSEWVIAYKDIEDCDTYRIRLFQPCEEPYSTVIQEVGKAPDMHVIRVLHPRKLPKDPTS